jgi:hypothetical protein
LGVCLRGGVRLGWQSLQFFELMVMSTSPFIPRACIWARDSRRLNCARGLSAPHLAHFL